MTLITAVMIVAAVANMAALMALVFARRELLKAEEANKIAAKAISLARSEAAAARFEADKALRASLRKFKRADEHLLSIVRH